MFTHSDTNLSTGVSNTTIARDTGLSRRTVIRALGSLERRGMMIVRTRGGPTHRPSVRQIFPYGPEQDNTGPRRCLTPSDEPHDDPD
jgi:predicted transcriptional regulator